MKPSRQTRAGGVDLRRAARDAAAAASAISRRQVAASGRVAQEAAGPAADLPPGR